MTFTFTHDINVSIQVGDIMYTSLIAGNGQGGTNPAPTGYDTKPSAIGTVTNVVRSLTGGTVTINPFSGIPVITNSHYLFFSKDPIVNTSGILGYFAETEYRNASTSRAEIFATAADYVESSK